MHVREAKQKLDLVRDSAVRYGLGNLREACMRVLLNGVNADTVGCLVMLSGEHGCEEVMEVRIKIVDTVPDA